MPVLAPEPARFDAPATARVPGALTGDALAVVCKGSLLWGVPGPVPGSSLAGEETGLRRPDPRRRESAAAKSKVPRMRTTTAAVTAERTAFDVTPCFVICGDVTIEVDFDESSSPWAVVSD